MFTYMARIELRGASWHGRLTGPDVTVQSRNFRGEPFRAATLDGVKSMVREDLAERSGGEYELVVLSDPAPEAVKEAQRMTAPGTLRVCTVESGSYSGEWSVGLGGEHLDQDWAQDRAEMSDEAVVETIRMRVRAMLWLTPSEAGKLEIEPHRHTVSDKVWEDSYMQLMTDAEENCAKLHNAASLAFLRLLAAERMQEVAGQHVLVAETVALGVSRWGGVNREVWSNPVSSEARGEYGAAALAEASRHAGQVLASMSEDTARMLMWGAGAEYALYAAGMGL